MQEMQCQQALSPVLPRQALHADMWGQQALSPVLSTSRQALHAEVVVTFEGVTEAGALFSAKRSYLPGEIHWGYVFAPIVLPAGPGCTQHAVDLSRCAQHSCTTHVCRCGCLCARGHGVVACLWRQQLCLLVMCRAGCSCCKSQWMCAHPIGFV